MFQRLVEIPLGVLDIGHIMDISTIDKHLKHI